MDSVKQDKFMKELISCETREAITELKDIINDQDIVSEQGCENLKSLISLCLQQSEEVKNGGINRSVGNHISRSDIIGTIKYMLEHKLDFSNRLNGKRNILELWQKTRASKNEELSIKLRESGNDYLRIAQLNKALCLYNEALLFGYLIYQNDNLTNAKTNFVIYNFRLAEIS